MNLVIDTRGASLKVRNHSFQVSHKTRGSRIISPHKISSIHIIAQCNLSSSAVRLSIAHDIPIHFGNNFGRTEGTIFSHRFKNIASLRRNQALLVFDSSGTTLVKKILMLKKVRQMECVKTLGKLIKRQMGMDGFEALYEKIGALPLLPMNEVRNQILGLEGLSGKTYWQIIGKNLPENWRFTKRSRRPAKDYFNCILNYLYGMLYNLVEHAVLAAGMDPHFGLLHVDAYQKPTFVFDLIEPFRPWADSFLIQYSFANKHRNQGYFKKEKDGYWLAKPGRKIFVSQFNQYLGVPIAIDEIKTSRKNHIFRFVREIAAEIKEYEYLPG